MRLLGLLLPGSGQQEPPAARHSEGAVRLSSSDPGSTLRTVVFDLPPRVIELGSGAEPSGERAGIGIKSTDRSIQS